MEGCTYYHVIRQSALQYKEKRQNHWDAIAYKTDTWESRGKYYQKRITDIYKLLIELKNVYWKSDVEKGDSPVALKPSVGVGIDFSKEMIKRKRNIRTFNLYYVMPTS